jgi:putative sigma-54 modulation protein
MQIDVRGIHLQLSDTIVNYVQQHVGTALDRYERRVQSVDVRLSDGHSSKRHGTPLQCQVQVALRGLPPVFIQHSDEDLYAAIDAAASRTKRTVRRQIGRQRGRRTSGGEKRLTH